MPDTKEVRRRIKSASNTRQIIKAMEMVSAVKMQKATSLYRSAQGYRESVQVLINNLCSEQGNFDSVFFLEPNSKKDLIVVVTSDRGLCGSLNSSVVKLVVSSTDMANSDFIMVGKKGRDMLASAKINNIADFIGIMDKISFTVSLRISSLIIEKFTSLKYKSVKVFYPSYVSTLVQEPKMINILPLKPSEKKHALKYITFEPSMSVMLKELSIKIVEALIWQVIVEASAAENSARMVAMKNANDNAAELIDDLKLVYTQSRQAAITNELAEISAGRLAVGSEA